MKKHISKIMLGVFMLCVMISSNAIASQMTKEIEDEYVWVTFTRPVPGKTPSVTRDIRSLEVNDELADGTSDVRKVEIKKVQWQEYNAAKDKWVKMSTDTFQKGVIYRIQATFKPQNGYFLGGEIQNGAMKYKGRLFAKIYDPTTKEAYCKQAPDGTLSSQCEGTDQAMVYGDTTDANAKCLVVTFTFPECQSKLKLTLKNSEDKAFEIGRYEKKDVAYNLKWGSTDIVKNKKKYVFDSSSTLVGNSVPNTGLSMDHYSTIGVLKICDKSTLDNSGSATNMPKYGTANYKVKIVVYQKYYYKSKYVGSKFVGAAYAEASATMIRSKKAPYLQLMEMHGKKKTGPLKVNFKNDSYYPITIPAGTTAELVKGDKKISLKTAEKIVVNPGKAGEVSYKIISGNFNGDTTGYTLKTNWKWNGKLRKLKLSYNRLLQEDSGDEYYRTESKGYFYDESKWKMIHKYIYDDEY